MANATTKQAMQINIRLLDALIPNFISIIGLKRSSLGNNKLILVFTSFNFDLQAFDTVPSVTSPSIIPFKPTANSKRSSAVFGIGNVFIYVGMDESKPYILFIAPKPDSFASNC